MYTIRERDQAIHRQLRTVGITGTNGKTTTTSMLAAIVAAAGEVDTQTLTIGTFVNGQAVWVDKSFDAFVNAMDIARQRGGRTVAMEVTSDVLGWGFARVWPAHVAVFTNLSRDHFDEHDGPEGYLAAKAQLFMHIPPGGIAVLNADDPASALLREVLPAGVAARTYSGGDDPDATLAATHIERLDDTLRIQLVDSPLARRLGGVLTVPSPAIFNAWNALAAALAADTCGYPAQAIVNGLAHWRTVPGRFQIIARSPTVIVDYAHTPDAFDKLLTSARPLTGAGGRVICVFGCAGQRDPGKRPDIGAVVDARADVAIVTTNSARGEDVNTISDMIMSGVDGVQVEGTSAQGTTWRRVLDRATAIESALRDASPTDVVLVAGKGPDWREYEGENIVKFDDIEFCTRMCQSRRERG